MTWLMVKPSLGTQDGGWAASIPGPARDNTIASYASSRSSACGGLGILERLQPHWRLINQRKLPPPGFFSGFVPPGGKCENRILMSQLTSALPASHTQLT